MEYVFYPDVFWITNFILDAIALTFVGCIRKKGRRFLRIMIASSVGATATVCLFLVLKNFALFQLLVHFMVNPIVVLVAFPTKKVQYFFTNFVMTYFLMLILGGVVNWGMTTLGHWKYFWIWVLGGVGICAIGIYWLESKKAEKMEYDVLLMLGEKSIPLRGFLDTGNLLIDPIVQQPVHIIQQDFLKEELEKEQLAVRYIPFHSLGQENGLLPVVTLKAMYLKGVGDKEQVAPIYIEKPVFGIAKEKLFQKRNYQIILNAKGILQ